MYTSADLIETIDVRQLDNAHLGVLRVMFPGFAEEIELGRYVRRLLSRKGYQAVHLEPHRDANGGASPHVFDVFASRAPDASVSSLTPAAPSG
jgi:hypothetical protein